MVKFGSTPRSTSNAVASKDVEAQAPGNIGTVLKMESSSQWKYLDKTPLAERPNDDESEMKGEIQPRLEDRIHALGSVDIPFSSDSVNGTHTEHIQNQSPLSEHNLQALPSPSDKSIMPEAIGTETCPICILDFEEGDDVRILPCEGQHRFHQSCVDPWLLKLSSSCPICRHGKCGPIYP